MLLLRWQCLASKADASMSSKKTRLAKSAKCPCGTGRTYGRCCWGKKFEWVVDRHGNIFRSIPVSPLLKEILEFQKLRFIERFGRSPRPNDKIFFDAPDDLEDVDEEMIRVMRKIGIREELIYATERTGLMITEWNKALTPTKDLEEWYAAFEVFTASELLDVALRQKHDAISDLVVRHATTVGNAHEGITRATLRRFCPTKRSLIVTSGFIADGNGKRSRQIDCIIAEKPGTSIPGGAGQIVQIENVIAAIEVKTALRGHLEEALVNLRSVTDLSPRSFQVSDGALAAAYHRLTGRSFPLREEWGPEVCDGMHMLLIAECAWPLRIVVGYDSYSSQRSFATAFLKAAKTGSQAPLALPSLVVDANHAICRMTGMPWSRRLKAGRPHYLYAQKCGLKPKLAILDLLWTRLYLRGLLTKEFGYPRDAQSGWTEVAAVQAKIRPSQSSRKRRPATGRPGH